MRIPRFIPSALLTLLAAANAGAKARNPDLFTLYDVTRNAQIVLQGTVRTIDSPRQVVTLSIDKLWHGKVTPDQSGGVEGQVKYEVRGSLDPYRVGRRFVEFLDPNLPYGTQDPKTIMAPLKPRSPRNRVWLDDPDGKEYADFVLLYLALTEGDRGAKWGKEAQEHLVRGLEAKSDRLRLAAGETLADLLTLSDRGGKLPKELLSPEDKTAIARVFMKGETPGPGASLMKLAMTLDDASLAVGMVHGALYLPQSGIETKDALEKSLKLAAVPAAKAVRDEYAAAKSDAYREMLLQAMSAIGGLHGESFIWELARDEKRELLRREALLAYVCLPGGAPWEKVQSLYKKSAEPLQAELLPRIASCDARAAHTTDFLKGELRSARRAVRYTAAFEAARLGIVESLPVLEEVIASCRKEATPSADCLTALDGLRKLQTPDSISALEKAATAEGASQQFKEDAKAFIEDLRRISPSGS